MSRAPSRHAREDDHAEIARRLAHTPALRRFAQAIARLLSEREAARWIERLPEAHAVASNADLHLIVRTLGSDASPLRTGITAPAVAELTRGLRARFAPNYYCGGEADRAPEPHWKLHAPQRWYAWAARCAERAANEMGDPQRHPRIRAYRAGVLTARTAARACREPSALAWSPGAARAWVEAVGKGAARGERPDAPAHALAELFLDTAWR